MQRSNSNRDISNSAPAHMSHGGNTNFVYDLLRKIVQPTCQGSMPFCVELDNLKDTDAPIHQPAAMLVAAD